MRFRMTKIEKKLFETRCAEIVAEYAGQGFTVTVRQVHYQIVSRFPSDYPNTPETYKRVCRALADCRQDGRISWSDIEDRTRSLNSPAHWTNPGHILSCCADSYRVDLWASQRYRPEIWTEKQAVVNIVEGLQDQYHLTLYACRGFNSLSGVYETHKRFSKYIDEDQVPMILYLGDCDPSGQIMDGGENGIEAKLPKGALFERLALTAEQARDRGLPALAAKDSDSRTRGYVERNGSADCWEIDALAPDEIQSLITARLADIIDADLWNKALKEQVRGQKALQRIAKAS